MTDLNERALDEFEQWLNDCAVNLQNVAAKGAAECPSAHPCECWHFAEDGRRKVEQMLESANCDLQAKLIERDGEVERLKIAHQEFEQRLWSIIDPRSVPSDLVDAISRTCHQADRAEAATQECARLREALEKCVKELTFVRVFVTSRERIKRPEGEDLYDECLEQARQALFQPGPATAEAVEQENRDLRKALEFYAKLENYAHTDDIEDSTIEVAYGDVHLKAPARKALGPVLADIGERARQALSQPSKVADAEHSKPTIHELEAILDDPNTPPIKINPDGSVS